MSRATSPPPCVTVYRVPSFHKECTSTSTLEEAALLYEPDCRILVVQGIHTGTYHVGIEAKGQLYCVHCGFGTDDEAAWRRHSDTPRGQLLALTHPRTLRPARIERWTGAEYCCNKHHTLACKCGKRTNWVMVGTHASDVIQRIGLRRCELFDGLSLSAAANVIRQRPAEVALSLAINTTKWLLTSFVSLMAASVHAVFAENVLVYTEAEVDTRLKLTPNEFECVVRLIEATGALCPITCRCNNNPPCFRGIRRVFKSLRLSCGNPDHAIACRCK